MKFLLAILLTLVSLASTAGDFLMRTNTGLLGQTGWSFSTNNLYFADGAMYSRMNTGTSIRTGLLNYAGSPGVYRIWIRARAHDTGSGGTNMAVGLTIGDTNVLLTTSSSTPLWRSVAPVTVGVAFSNITMVATNPLGTSGPYDIYLNGFYFGSNTNEAFVGSSKYTDSDNLIVDYSPPTITNSTDLVYGNHVFNSSFEGGIAGGWTWARDQYTNGQPWLLGGLDTNTAHTGSNSMRIADVAARYQLFLPVIKLRGVTNVWRPYTFSFWCKSLSSATPVVNCIAMIPPVTGFPTPNSQTFTLTSATTNWTRKSTNIWLSLTPTREILFNISHAQTGTNSLWVDDIMLEEGHTTNSWAPMDSVEAVLRSKPPVHAFLLGETPYVDAYFVNGTADSVARRCVWQVFDNWNALKGAGHFDVMATPGVSTERITGIPATPGSYRMVMQPGGGHTGLNDAEILYAVLGYTAYATNAPEESLWGTHPAFFGEPAQLLMSMYIPWVRTLSPAATFRWGFIEPSDGTYDWSRPDFTLIGWTNLNILGNIGDRSDAPAWAITNGFPKEYALVRLMSNLVARYGTRVKAWEMPNEPHFAYTSNQLARITELCIQGVTNANPAAKFIAGGGQTYTYDFLPSWSLVNSNSKAFIHDASVHLYPELNQNTWNSAETDVNIAAWKSNYTALGLTGWNTESGVWGFPKVRVEGAWSSGGSYAQPFDFEEIAVRDAFVPERLMRQALRNVGYGFRYFQYDARQVYRIQVPETAPTLFYYNDTLSSQGAAYSFAAYLIRYSGGKLSAPSTNVESYLYQTADGRSVISGWTYYRAGTNANIVLTNSNFGVVNVFGDVIQSNNATVTIGRMPVYLVSSLSTGALAAAWSSGSISYAADVAPPNVTIDVSPHGTLTDSQPPLIFRWTVIDSNFVNTVDVDSKVTTRWQLEGDPSYTWSAWSNERRAMINSPLARTALRLVVQARDFASTTTNEVAGPYFSLGAISSLINAPTVIVSNAVVQQ